jgi:hypothetical protein
MRDSIRAVAMALAALDRNPIGGSVSSAGSMLTLYLADAIPSRQIVPRSSIPDAVAFHPPTGVMRRTRVGRNTRRISVATRVSNRVNTNECFSNR